MLRKRVRVTNVAPFLFLGCTPFLLFILLVTPLDITYAQDDTGEIFWGDEEEDEDEFVDEGEFEEEEFDEGELSSTELSDDALKMGYTLTLHGASPGLVSHSLYTYLSLIHI